MRKTEQALFDAKIENATLKIEVEALRRSQAASDVVLVRLEDQLKEMNELKTKNAVLMERLDLLANHLPPAPTEAWNHISEEQEDADYRLHAGQIDRDEYEAILAAAGALNTEVHFDSDPTRL